MARQHQGSGESSLKVVVTQRSAVALLPRRPPALRDPDNSSLPAVPPFEIDFDPCPPARRGRVLTGVLSLGVYLDQCPTRRRGEVFNIWISWYVGDSQGGAYARLSLMTQVCPTCSLILGFTCLSRCLPEFIMHCLHLRVKSSLTT